MDKKQYAPPMVKKVKLETKIAVLGICHSSADTMVPTGCRDPLTACHDPKTAPQAAPGEWWK